MKDEFDNIFGRLDEAGNVALLYEKTGNVVTRLDENIYPIDSPLSAKYEHPEGITVSLEDAEILGVEVE